MTYRSRVVDFVLQRNVATLGLVALSGLVGCGSVAEWERREGQLELFAGPLPAVANQGLWVAVRAQNVGPVEVFQGEQRIASFVGVDLSDGVTHTVVAVSNEVPRAVAVAYDFKRLEVTAVPYAEDSEPPTKPEPEPEDPKDDEPPENHDGLWLDCSGAEKDVAPSCTPPTGEPITVRFRNERSRSVDAYELIPLVVPAGQCIPSVVAIVPAKDVRESELEGGSVIQIGDSVEGRFIALPETLPEDASCTIWWLDPP